MGMGNGKQKSKPLSNPLIPKDVDMRDMPIPFQLFVQIAMDDCGLSRREAEILVRDASFRLGLLTTESTQ